MDQNNGFIEKEAKDLARQIARERIAPNAGERDRNSAFPREAIQTLGDSGILGMVVSENHGGSGASRTAFASMTSELGCACASTALVVVSHIIAEKAIEVAATDVIKGKWLPPLMAGWALELLLCTEPTAAAMPDDYHHGEEGWRLLHRQRFKIFITSAGEADVYLCLSGRTRKRARKG